MIEKIFPKNIIAQDNCYVDNEFLSETKTQKKLTDLPLLTLKERGFIVIDFGSELCGRVHVLFTMNNSENTKIRLRAGESVAETYAETGENNAGNHHSLRDQILPVVLSGDVSGSESGFRFARIDNLSDAEINIRIVFAENSIFRKEGECYFVTDDKEINEIYNIAKRTLALCIQNGVIWDGIKRDREVWLGDFHPELLAASAVYGKMEEFAAVLDGAEDFIRNGEWVNLIPAYSAWWLICLNEYYRSFADRGYIESKKSAIMRVLGDFFVIVKEDGKIDYSDSALKMYQDNEFFFDWPTLFTEDAEYGFVALLGYAFRETKKLLSELRIESDLPDMLIERIKKHGVTDSVFKQVESFQYLSGLKTALKKQVFLGNESKNMTCFMSYYIFTAMAETGMNREIIPAIKEFFGGMIKLGATTFWEDFDTDWLKEDPQTLAEIPQKNRKNIHVDYGKYCYKGLRHSLCHGWSSGITAFFVKKVLGVEPVTAGYSEIRIKPNLYGLNYAEGTVSTPFGNIFVKHRKENGKTVSEIKLPAGVKINDKKDIY